MQAALLAFFASLCESTSNTSWAQVTLLSVLDRLEAVGLGLVHALELCDESTGSLGLSLGKHGVLFDSGCSCSCGSVILFEVLIVRNMFVKLHLNSLFNRAYLPKFAV